MIFYYFVYYVKSVHSAQSVFISYGENSCLSYANANMLMQQSLSYKVKKTTLPNALHRASRLIQL